MAQPGADGFAYVTGKDAHAWTEVYFEGFGWVPFDATPQQQEMGGDNQQDPAAAGAQPLSFSHTQSAAARAGPAGGAHPPVPTPQPQQDPDVPPAPAGPAAFPWWLVLIAAAVAALVVRIHLRMPAHMAAKATGESDKSSSMAAPSMLCFA